MVLKFLIISQMMLFIMVQYRIFLLLLKESGYDLINPPLVTITDPVGSGVSAFC